MSNHQAPPETVTLHESIAAYYGDPVLRKSRVRDMFNRTARHYDAANHIFALGSGGLYRRACLRWAGLAPGMRVLDVATGTGLLAREILRITGDRVGLIGVDVSEAMLAIARGKLGYPLVQAAAEALPLRTASVDFVAMGYALRHLAELPAAFAEALRVLRPGGTLVLLEISAPRKKLHRAVATWYIGGLVPLLARVTTRDERARALMRYHWDTIVHYMPPEAVLEALAERGFTALERWTELDLFHCFKARKPD